MYVFKILFCLLCELCFHRCQDFCLLGLVFPLHKHLVMVPRCQVSAVAGTACLFAHSGQEASPPPQCCRLGSGRVPLPPGLCLSGPLMLQRNVWEPMGHKATPSPHGGSCEATCMVTRDGGPLLLWVLSVGRSETHS